MEGRKMEKEIKGIVFQAKAWKNRIYFNSKNLNKSQYVSACWDKEKGEFIKCQNRPGAAIEAAIREAFQEIL